MRILLVRHGEPNYEIDSLTEKGFKEAELLSDRLTKTKIDDFYLSPLGRAQDTARPTLHKLNRKAQTLSWLQEFRGRVEIPDVREGKPKDAKVNWLAWNFPTMVWTQNDTLLKPQEGFLQDDIYMSGTFMQVYNEAKEGFLSLMANYGFYKDGLIWRTQDNPDKTICLVCHFGMSMVILSVLTDMSLPHLWGSFFMPTSSVTTIVSEERTKGLVTFKAVQVGDTSHLYKFNEPYSPSGLFQEIYKETQEYKD